MSRIIKSDDKEAVRSVKRFEKRPFDVSSSASRPKRTSAVTQKPKPGSEEKIRDPGEVVERARREAEEIVQGAESRAEQIQDRAREQGFSQGLEEGREQSREELRASLRMVESLIEQLKAQESELMRMLTPRLASLATELAAKIIHREIDKNSSIVTTQAEEAISKILEREKLIIRVNPADSDALKEHKQALMSMFDGIDKIEVIADQKIERGGCVVETNLVKVDAQPGSQLAAASKTLLTECDK